MEVDLQWLKAPSRKRDEAPSKARQVEDQWPIYSSEVSCDEQMKWVVIVKNQYSHLAYPNIKNKYVKVNDFPYSRAKC